MPQDARRPSQSRKHPCSSLNSSITGIPLGARFGIRWLPINAAAAPISKPSAGSANHPASAPPAISTRYCMLMRILNEDGPDDGETEACRSRAAAAHRSLTAF